MNTMAAKIAASFIISPKDLRLVYQATNEGWRIRRPHFTRGRIEILRAKFENRERTTPIDSGVDAGAPMPALWRERASRAGAARALGNRRVRGLRDGVYRQRAGVRGTGAGFRLGRRALEGSGTAQASAARVCFSLSLAETATAEYERADALADATLG